jgi:oligopeptidase B
VADLLHEEPDALFRFHVGRSRSLAYLFLISGSFTSTEVRYLAAGDPGGAWRMVLPREPDHEYQVDHRREADGDVFSSAPTAAAGGTSGWWWPRWTIRIPRAGAS